MLKGRGEGERGKRGVERHCWWYALLIWLSSSSRHGNECAQFCVAKMHRERESKLFGGQSSSALWSRHPPYTSPLQLRPCQKQQAAKTSLPPCESVSKAKTNTANAWADLWLSSLLPPFPHLLIALPRAAVSVSVYVRVCVCVGACNSLQLAKRISPELNKSFQHLRLN